MRVPTNVAKAVCSRWPRLGPGWLGQVEAELVELAGRFEAQPRRVLPARYGFVVELDRDDDSQLVMRATADPDGPFQATSAQLLGIAGVGPVVHEIRATSTGTWTVMDRVVPGTPIDFGASPADLAVILRPLVAEQPPAPDLPPLTSWLRERLADVEPADLPPGLSVAPAHERDYATALLADLGDDHAVSLCHGDCSRGNVVQGSTGLALIDPRGLAGDIAYDVAVLAAKTGNNPAGLSGLLGVDPDRAQAWAVIAGAARV